MIELSEFHLATVGVDVGFKNNILDVFQKHNLSVESIRDILPLILAEKTRFEELQRELEESQEDCERFKELQRELEESQEDCERFKESFYDLKKDIESNLENVENHSDDILSSLKKITKDFNKLINSFGTNPPEKNLEQLKILNSLIASKYQNLSGDVEYLQGLIDECNDIRRKYR